MTFHRASWLIILSSLFIGCRTTSPHTAAIEKGFVGFGILPNELQSLASPVPGRYLGYVKLAEGKAKVPATLDLVYVASEGKRLEYMGSLKLSLGGFGSFEYVSSHYPKIVQEDGKPELIFMTDDTALSLSAVNYVDGSITAKLESDKTKPNKILGELTLTLQKSRESSVAASDDTTPELALIPGLAGRYAGTCSEKPARLELEVAKWRGVKYADQTPFGGYRLGGRLGKVDETLCEKGQLCAKAFYQTGRFDYLTGELLLEGPSAKQSCNIDGELLTCGACVFTKEVVAHTTLDKPRSPMIYKRAEHLEPLSTQSLERAVNGETVEPAIYAGQYYGYLHHENRDAYQLLALNVEALSLEGGQRGLKLEAVATLYFGEGDSNEYIAYRFKPSEFRPEARSFVLNGEGETYLLVTSWDGQLIKGTWFSKTFGRVGTVELQRGLVPTLGPASEKLLGLAGGFHSENWDYEITVSANISEQEAEFYPLRLFGWAKERFTSSRRRTIEEGVYDFYTGALSFKLDDGRMVIGHAGGDAVTLYWPPQPRAGETMNMGKIQTFSANDAGKAAQHAQLREEAKTGTKSVDDTETAKPSDTP